MAVGAGMMAGRLVCVMLAGLCATPAAAMPGRVAISAGSFFSAATRCEAQDLISPGQTAALREALNRYLTVADRRNINIGYARGMKDSALYVIELKRWVPFTPDSSSCYRVQGVLDDYKSQLGPD
jgi:hypothetical protein